jgi:uncharacterized protein
MPRTQATYTVFAGSRLIVSSDLKTTLLRTKQHLDRGGHAVLIFEDQTGRQVDFDFSGTPDDVLARATSDPQPAGPGRPKLGVVCREICLLPRHWDWLEAQPNGASAALRRLVEEARKHEPEQERARSVRDAAAKFMWAMAGDLPGFEEASRALFASDRTKLEGLIRKWPKDVREHVLRLVRGAFHTAKAR